MQRVLIPKDTVGRPGENVEQVIGDLREEIDLPQFQRAWQHIADRHAILRGGICALPAEPTFRIHAAVDMPLELNDWRALPPALAREKYQAWLAADRERGFVLENSPLLRLTLFRFADAHYRLVWTFHHVLLDARSFAIVLSEVIAAYEAFRAGREPDLPATAPYRDFVEWQRARDFSESRRYWREMLRGCVDAAAIELPAPPPRPRGEASHGECEYRFSAETEALIHATAQQLGVTVGTLVQAAWALVLSLYSGKDDVLFGVVRAGRGTASTFDADRMVGLLINTVPVRVRVEMDWPMRRWLTHLHALRAAMRPHEEMPLASILECGTFAGAPRPFQSLLSFQNPPWTETLRRQGGAWANRRFQVLNQPDVPVWLDVFAGAGFGFRLGYDRSVIDDPAAAALAGHFKAALEQLPHQLDRRVGEFSPLSAAEQGRLLAEWNDTARDFPSDIRAHECFEAQAKKTPEALALTAGNQRFTYAELDAAATELSTRLAAFGIRGSVVGICFERSPQFVMALLAVLKAGGAYAPLDPAYPAEWLAHAIREARMPLVLTQQKWAAALAAAPAKIVCLEAVDSERASEPAAMAEPANASDIAYVIHTSGSTGQPKAVAVTHRSLMNLVAWHQREYGVTPADRATLLASPAFDASVWELWPYLASGASVHIPDEATRVSADRLAGWLQREQISAAFVPTPLCERLFDEVWPARPALRVLLTGGDRLHRRPPRGFPCRVVNHYGPTEATVVTTAATVAPGDDHCPPPIGRPIANTQLFVLDAFERLVPVGVPGELHIGGAGLAKGYLHRPEFTERSFVTRSISGVPRRLYKTGDLVRYRRDGNLEFIGRADRQVKVCGCRVELGEIESSLVRHPSVRQAAVLTVRAPVGDRIVAYVVMRAAAEPDAAQLRGYLQSRLPAQMIPGEFIPVEALPLMPNGKIDTAALAALRPPSPRDAAIAPRNGVEEQLAAIWGEVLGRDAVGIHDDFFQLGGHSLAAAQVVSRVAARLGHALTLRDVFDAPTVAGLAGRIPPPVAREASPAPRSPRAAAVPLSFAQERIWFLEHFMPDTGVNNIPVAFKVEGALEIEALERSLAELVRRHDVFRTAIRNHESRPHGWREPLSQFVMQRRDLSALASADARRIAEEQIVAEARRPFDLARPPFLRACLFKLAPDEHLLLLVTHHIVCDGWSMGLLLEDLETFYQAFVRGNLPPVAPLREFAGFAEEQRKSLTPERTRELLEFWTRELEGAPFSLELPASRVRPAVQTCRGGRVPLAVPAALMPRLNALCREEGVTLFMLLLAAFQTLLHRYSGQEDILVGSPVAGRGTADAERVIGLFLNLVVMRGRMAGDPSFIELLRRTRRGVLDALAHQELPFEKLAETLAPERDLSRPPLFQAMFVLQTEPLRPLSLAGLAVSEIEAHSGTAKYDITLSLQQNDGGLSGGIEYNSDLFDREVIERLAGHFDVLLQSIAARPELPLSRLALLPEAERQQLVAGWNNTRAEVPRGTIHGLFEARAAAAPAAIALAMGKVEISYGDLNERASRVAARLRHAGAEPGGRIGLCLERSPYMVAAMLGILKAGCAYVPLDPAYPAERLAFMVEDSGCKFLIASRETASLCARAEVNTLDIAELISTDADAPVAGPADPGLAYVIYTSGSTGKPKGVMVSHRNVLNFFGGMDRILGTQPGVWLAVTTISFDISVLELLWTLARGYKVVLHGRLPQASGPSADGAPDGVGSSQMIPDLVARHRVSHFQCTPSFAGAVLLAPGATAALRPLKAMLVGGEALPLSLARRLRESVGGELFNMYGPTETTVWSTFHPVRETAEDIPIGRPMANTRVYLLDAHFQLVPAGVPGELFIGGDGVACGYLNRPGLTDERFVPDPFSNEPGAKLYRTGDRARYRRDGVLEFLGRVDRQLKIRGHRVEPGEIESALRAYPGVRECAVVTHEPSPGDVRLAAYVVARDGADCDGAALKRHLQGRLPAYMIPSTFVPIPSLPTTPNGKLRRDALPKPEAATAREANHQPPRTEMEKRITRLWQELLGVNHIGVRDNFFELGGHSLLVVQAQARLRELIGVHVPVVRLFQYPTVAALAEFVGSAPKRISFHSAQERGRRQRAAFVQHRITDPVLP